MYNIFPLFLLLSFYFSLPAQPYLGADLSYVNEMEDCGAIYYDADGNASDPYELFAENGCSMVRLRLWHTPAWYDTLNTGQRYSDLTDVKQSISRSKQQNMPVLLDFHLSDFWADPSRQWIPQAWLPVVEDLPILQDSLHQYIFQTLTALHQEDLLPEMVQIGNETNREILQTVEDNAEGDPINWSRNSALFNTAIQAVRDFEEQSGQTVQIMLHFAGPEATAYFVEAFTSNGVTDFDIIGISYYWQWHQPTTIEEMGNIIANLQTAYPAYESIIVETGYPWTSEWADAANNTLSESAPGYGSLSPATQLQWLSDMAQAAISNGALGVIYWEPAWVSTPCSTPWAQGSHYENATFFDFDNRVLKPGGMDWFGQGFTSSTEQRDSDKLTIPKIQVSSQYLTLYLPSDWQDGEYQFKIMDAKGSLMNAHSGKWNKHAPISIALYSKNLPAGIYFLNILDEGKTSWSQAFFWPG